MATAKTGRSGTVHTVEIMTSAGPAHVVLDKPAARPAFLAVLTHGSGALTALVTQPYRVRGARAPGSAARQDAAWTEIVAVLNDAGLPLVQGDPAAPARSSREVTG